MAVALYENSNFAGGVTQTAFEFFLQNSGHPEGSLAWLAYYSNHNLLNLGTAALNLYNKILSKIAGGGFASDVPYAQCGSQ